MSIQQNVTLKAYNTFGIPARARYFTTVNTISALKTLLSDAQWQQIPKLILGEGSNVLFTQDFEGLVIHNQIKGIEQLGDDENFVWLRVHSGENWHQLVLHCVKNNYAGIENLSLIPGTVGAAPIQNIGAYGVELKETLQAIDVLSIDGKQNYTLGNADCQFAYRDSIFKNALKNKCVITHVTLRLNKKPVFKIDYGAIKETLKKNNIAALSLKAISDAVIQIRQSKLPDPKKMGNAGSFFKNPIVSKITLHALQKQYPDIPFYELPGECAKLPAAWLIEQCGLKGKRFGEVGIHARQALVLVNYGNGTGADINALQDKIIKTVYNAFKIQLTPEVSIY